MEHFLLQQIILENRLCLRHSEVFFEIVQLFELSHLVTARKEQIFRDCRPPNQILKAFAKSDFGDDQIIV